MILSRFVEISRLCFDAAWFFHFFEDLCIRETLRLFPTAPIIGRVPTKPVTLSNNVEVPPGIPIIFRILSLHKFVGDYYIFGLFNIGVPIIFGLREVHIREKYYGKTAKQFDPYRFLDENVKNLPGGAYIPFSYGARNCIGKSKLFSFFFLIDNGFICFCSGFRLLLCKSIGEMLHCALNSELSTYHNLQKYWWIDTSVKHKHEIIQ